MFKLHLNFCFILRSNFMSFSKEQKYLRILPALYPETTNPLFHASMLKKKATPPRPCGSVLRCRIKFIVFRTNNKKKSFLQPPRARRSTIYIILILIYGKPTLTTRCRFFFILLISFLARRTHVANAR